jgi:cytochrome P450
MPVQTVLWFTQPERFFKWCHRKNDPVTLRLAMNPTIVLTKEPELARRFLTLPPEVASPVEENAVMEPLLGSRSMLMVHEPDHTRLRQLAAPFFRREAVREQDDVIVELTQREVDSWPKSQPFPLLPRMRVLTLKIMLRVLFGLEESTRQKELAHAFERLLSAANAWIVPTWFRRDLPASPWRRFLRRKHYLDELLLAEVDRISDSGRASGVLAHLLHARDQGLLTREELLDQLVTLLVAGHETTATSLSWAFLFLAHNPPTPELVQDDQFLDNAVKETLRLRSVFQHTSRRLRQPLEVDRWTLPPGTSVGASLYMLHRRPDIYPEPELFRPDRWKLLQSAPASGAWIPFGGGNRRCLGALFTQFEMAVVLRTTFAKVRIRPARPTLEPVAVDSLVLVPKRGANITAHAYRTS